MKQIITLLLAVLLGTANLSAQEKENINPVACDSTCTHRYEDHSDIYEYELEIVTVTRSVGAHNMRTKIIPTTRITSHELSKAACCNLSESFTTNPSVDVSYSDAATGAKQIKLLGLSGNYVQMLTENFPNLRGLASTYGLNYIPGTWIEGIMLSKGAASVLNGYESVTGQINVELKKPSHSEKLAVNLFAGDEGRFEANITSGIKLTDNLSTGILAHATENTIEQDHNKDGFLDQPKVRQYQLLNRWEYAQDDYHGQVGFKALYEERNSGQTRKIPNPYKIGIETNRYEFFLKNGYVFDHEKEKSLALVMSASQHEQDAFYGNKLYDAKQTNLYANLIFATNFNEHHKISTGASINSDLIDEKYQAESSSPFAFFDRNEVVPGIFGEYTMNLDDKLMLLLGLRGDHSNLFGFFATPRMHIKYEINNFIHLRASAGKAYRTPNILAENSFLLAGNRQIQDMDLLNELKQEEAWNYGMNLSFYIPVGQRELSLNAEYYRTDFQQQVVVDMDSNPNSVSFYNLDNGRSFANSVQVEASYEFARNWKTTIAHRIQDTKTTIGGVLREKPLTSRYKSLLTTSYHTPKKDWQFDFTAQLNGGGRMPDPDPTNPLWEKEFKPFEQLQAQITRYFNTWSVYVGSENLTGFVQKNPIISANDVSSPNFDASMIYGPLMGRTFYVGLSWCLK
jgi:outer membrane receptor for ferrienterochelin and colicin